MRRIHFPRPCEQCGAEFTPKQALPPRRYCSMRCRNLAYSEGKYGRVGVVSRLEAKTLRGEGDDACWEWTGSITLLGYGQVLVGGVKHYVHRLAWGIEHGPIPDGMCVCHTCDNPPCVRPSHLFLGTKEDNSRDMSAKERWRNQHAAGVGAA